MLPSLSGFEVYEIKFPTKNGNEAAGFPVVTISKY